CLEATETEGDEEEIEAECKLLGVLGSMGEHHTMKICGKIAGIEVVVLIDSGASHNFISPDVTTALGLLVTPTTAKSIKLGDGHRVFSQGTCEGVQIALGPESFEVDALVLELGGLDVVLGVSWLSTLGKVVMDWKDLSMQFIHEGRTISLQAQSKMQDKQSCLNSFLEDKHRGGGEEWWWTNHVDVAVEQTTGQNAVAELLSQFSEVFKE
ncbi:pentatricopeptide repeat-containing protein, partial [Trifolium medium]|nr:pentatricopeptide repeat-containing protein [Trifolium medium]